MLPQSFSPYIYWVLGGNKPGNKNGNKNGNKSGNKPSTSQVVATCNTAGNTAAGRSVSDPWICSAGSIPRSGSNHPTAFAKVHGIVMFDKKVIDSFLVRNRDTGFLLTMWNLGRRIDALGVVSVRWILCSLSSRRLTVIAVVASLIGSVMLTAVCGAEVATKMRGVYRMKVGDFEVIALSDGINRRSIDQQLQLLQGDRDKNRELLQRAYPDGQVESTVNTYLIDTGSKLVLVDTGNGRMGSPTMGKVWEHLRLAGYDPEQIDEVYLTHMHGDHIGGLIRDGERVFPKATVYANKREADYWLDSSNMDAAPPEVKRTFQAVQTAVVPYINAGLFKTFAGNQPLSQGIRAEELFGHTPGHTAYVVESQGKKLLLWGDIVHVAAVQFADPSVTLAFDSDKAAAAAVRCRILKEAAQNQWLIGGIHLAFPGLGYAQATGSGYVFVPLTNSAE